MEAWFNLQHEEKLFKEVSYWVKQDNLPINFLVYVYIYHAKMSKVLVDKTTSELYLNKALTLLSSINKTISRPMRLIEIANLQTANGQLTNARETLLTLERKFSKSGSPRFNSELYTNFGHVAYQLKQYKQHVDYRIKALEWSKLLENKQQLGIAHYNLARALHLISSYQEAKKHYLRAYDLAIQAHDTIIQITSQLRIVEVLLLQGSNDEAYDHFLKVTRENFPLDTPKVVLKQYDRLQNELSTYQDKLDNQNN